jgi:hypothetical protein
VALLGQGKGIWQCQDTEKKTAGMPGGFMKLVGFHPSSSAYMAHDASDADSGSHRLARWRRDRAPCQLGAR